MMDVMKMRDRQYNSLDTNSVVKGAGDGGKKKSGEQLINNNNNINTANRYSENVTELKYFGTTVTNLYLISEEIKRRLKWGNSCYCSA
jgi:hypothetical protein